ncbi:PREDICTED: uncharacterized protein LOC106818284 [Priapulus caudatus]|uniref:Uncharacterized protein LOC106818284 n=1 Tax=Priapulus caudatus TaxID=37621 RepID=A0ABM1F221_PRICU|nr:PREDICTED: uncharacterized protein LOC106818284 [Priapulus caudatus]
MFMERACMVSSRQAIVTIVGAIVVIELLRVYFVNNGYKSNLRYSEKSKKKSFHLEVTVLTYNSADSLRRLLQSLENAEYDHDSITLHICIDGAKVGDELSGHRQTVRVAGRFQFTHGEKVLTVRSRNVGVTAQWLDCWNPDVSPGNYGLILEDDLRLSPYYYRWLKAAIITYSGHREVGGITLFRETLVAGQIPMNHRDPLCTVCGNQTAFLYRFSSNSGYAPMPSIWRKFRQWLLTTMNKTADTDQFLPYVLSQNVVMNSWITNDFLRRNAMSIEYYQYYFMATHNLFTLYANLPASKTLACVRRSDGKKGKTRRRQTGKCDVEPLAAWDEAYGQFSANSIRLDWDGYPAEYFR